MIESHSKRCAGKLAFALRYSNVKKSEAEVP